MQWRSASPDRYAILKEFAKENRNHMTEAERVLWSLVKGNALGHKFLRQHIIGDYIVDFLCRDANVIVEIDGGYHLERSRPSKSPCLGRLYDTTIEVETTYVDQVEEDHIRQDWLEHMGYKVIRFTNEQVLFDTDNTINTILSNVNSK